MQSKNDHKFNRIIFCIQVIVQTTLNEEADSNFGAKGPTYCPKPWPTGLIHICISLVALYNWCLITCITRPLDAMVDSPRSNHNHNKIQNKVNDQENGCCWFWPSRSHEALEVWSLEIARGKLNAATLVVEVQVQDKRELYKNECL